MKNAIIVLILISTINIFSQNCVSDFSYVVDTNSGQVTFTDLSFNYDSAQASTWSWDFGDGTTSIEQNPVHIYNDVTQSYNVCLNVIFFQPQCEADFCDTISFGYIEPECNMYLTYTQNNVTTNGGNDGSINLTILDFTNSLSFIWSNSAVTEDIYNLTANIYNVTITDGAGCEIDTFITIIEPPVDSCNMYLTSIITDVTTHGGNDGSIDLTISDYTNSIEFIWSNEETTEDIFNLTANTYNVTITDGAGCEIDTFITIIEPPLVLSLSGNVYAKTALLPQGVAVLIKKEQIEYTAIEYTSITNGYYIFNNIDTGEYLVHTTPYFGIDVNYFPIYFPTYAGNTLKYSYAEIIYVDSIHTKDISLKYNQDINHGNGVVSGKLVYDYGSGFETNIYNQNWFGGSKANYEGIAQNIPVFLINTMGQILKYNLTNTNGEFKINDIPYGQYFIYTEKAGRETQTFKIVITEENDSSINNIIHIKNNNIIEVKSIIDEIITVYPNPVKNILTITNPQLIINSVKIIDVTGKVMRCFSNKKEENIVINISDLQSGVYFLHATGTDSERFVKKIFKR